MCSAAAIGSVFLAMPDLQNARLEERSEQE